jgi:hypothetical protein
MKSKHLFAIESEIQHEKKPKDVFFIIVDGVVITIYQTPLYRVSITNLEKKFPMFEAFDITTILKLTIG